MTNYDSTDMILKEQYGLVPYNRLDNEETELINLINEVRELNSMNMEINKLLLTQEESIEYISDTVEISQVSILKGNNDLEESYRYKSAILPTIIGAGVGGLVSIPILIPLTGIGIISGIGIIGGSLLGGIVGKSLK